jgi:hypothetical protein
MMTRVFRSGLAIIYLLMLCATALAAPQRRTALDTKTNLMWMTKDSRNIEGRAPNDWDEAMAWAEKMNRQHYGGYSDWRVPKTEEYRTIYAAEKTKRSYTGNAIGYSDAFEDGGGMWFWSGDPGIFSGGNVDQQRTRLRTSVHGFNFRTGQITPRWLSDNQNDASVRLVRQGL